MEEYDNIPGPIPSIVAQEGLSRQHVSDGPIRLNVVISLLRMRGHTSIRSR